MRSVSRLARMGLAAGLVLAAAACAGDAVTAPVAPAPQVSPPGASNILQALQGRVEGVRIATPGQAGAPARIRICGFSGERMTGRPLFVIDGAVVQHTIAHGLDPNRIESISVLKGLQAVEIYGPEARDGAVIVRTKDGSGRGAAPDPAAR